MGIKGGGAGGGGGGGGGVGGGNEVESALSLCPSPKCTLIPGIALLFSICLLICVRSALLFPGISLLFSRSAKCLYLSPLFWEEKLIPPLVH